MEWDFTFHFQLSTGPKDVDDVNGFCGAEVQVDSVVARSRGLRCRLNFTVANGNDGDSVFVGKT